MTIQNIFYIFGIVAFSLSSILLIIFIASSLGIVKRVKGLLYTLEESMESNVVATIVQLVPLIASIYTELTDRKPSTKRGKRK